MVRFSTGDKVIGRVDAITPADEGIAAAPSCPVTGRSTV